VYTCQGSCLLCARCRDVQRQGAQSRSPQGLTIMTTTIVITITTTTIITINTKACMFVPLLSRSMGSGTRTFDFDCVIGLGCCAIVVAECCAVSGLFFSFLNFSQDLFSQRVTSRSSKIILQHICDAPLGSTYDTSSTQDLPFTLIFTPPQRSVLMPKNYTDAKSRIRDRWPPRPPGHLPSPGQLNSNKKLSSGVLGLIG